MLDDEPDTQFWYDEATKLPCAMRRNLTYGVLCGYVGVTVHHQLFGHDRTTSKAARNLTAHGGVNFFGLMPEEVPLQWKEIWWFGFDCFHQGDRIPAFDDLLSSPLGEKDLPLGEHRDPDFIKKECAKLAAQIAAIEPRKS